jgi:hypothetical protein
MGFVEVEEDKKPGNSPPFMVWRDEGACWHKNTRKRLWICIVIKLYIVLLQALFLVSALPIVSYYQNAPHFLFVCQKISSSNEFIIDDIIIHHIIITILQVC